MNSYEIKTLFSAKGIHECEILILTPAVAIEMVERAEMNGVDILGLDAFFVTPEPVQPSMEDGIDFTALPETSGLPSVSNRWQYTTAHLINICRQHYHSKSF